MSRNIKIWVQAEVHPSAYELAECFWAMDAEEQCGFFHRLEEIAQHMLPFQLQAIIDSKHMTKEARAAMQYIGEYAQEIRLNSQEQPK